MGRKNNRRNTDYRKLGPIASLIPPKRMQIWFARLPFNRMSSVQGGNRPVIIVSNDIGNEKSDTVTVLPITGFVKRLGLPTHVLIEEGLDFPSTVLAEQITTIDKRKLVKKYCTCRDPVIIKQIEKAIKVQLGL